MTDEKKVRKRKRLQHGPVTPREWVDWMNDSDFWARFLTLPVKGQWPKEKEKNKTKG